MVLPTRSAKCDDSPQPPGRVRGGPSGGLAKGRCPRAYGTPVWLLAAILALAAASPSGALSIVTSFPNGASDGSSPNAPLASDGAGNLYGTTASGGLGQGIVFTIRTAGTGFAVLHDFVGGPSDGSTPEGGVVLDGNGRLYGTTAGGGASGAGTVYTLNTDGTGFLLLHSMGPTAQDGVNPQAGLVLDQEGNLFGTTYGGGANFVGTIFTLRTDGAGFVVLHDFNAFVQSDGWGPLASLVLDNTGFLYGTTLYGGDSNVGTIFKVACDGTQFSLLHSFTGLDPDGNHEPLVLDEGGNLYGTTPFSGTGGAGTVFKIGTDGSGFAIVHNFGVAHLEGAGPAGGLRLDGVGNLYGTTYSGGAWGAGTVFKLRTDGSRLEVLHSFVGGVSEGWSPYGPLLLDGAGTLFGTTKSGGEWYAGTLFRLNTDGNGFANLHSFSGTAPYGANPNGSLAVDAVGDLYGTTPNGGAFGKGTVFKVGADGTGLTVVHTFGAGNTDGAHPLGGVVLDGAGNLYGTTSYGDPSTAGTVFRVRTDGTGFVILHSFHWSDTSDGSDPSSALIFDEVGNLFGTTYGGGSAGGGTVFSLRTDGTGFTILHSFAISSGPIAVQPIVPLVLDGEGNLFGTTGNCGTVYRLKTDGAEFSVLHAFYGGADGCDPLGSLVLDGAGNLYGTTASGGLLRNGTVFTLKVDGAGYRVLHTFAGGASDGARPVAPLLLDAAGNLYGTTSAGGATDKGIVFTIRPDGAAFAVLHAFTGAPSDGASPSGGLVMDGRGGLYGTTAKGGLGDLGTIYSFHVTSRVPRRHLTRGQS